MHGGVFGMDGWVIFLTDKKVLASPGEHILGGQKRGEQTATSR
jgi:hypothetical protein